MDFSPNKTPVEVIGGGAFGGTYFREIYSGVNGKWYKNSWKELVQLKDINAKFYALDCCDKKLNKYTAETGTSLRFWENKSWINKTDPDGWFQWYFRYWLSRRTKDGERQIHRWKKIVSRFRGKLFKTIKDAGSKLDDYSISPKIRPILLHWGYELTEKIFLHELKNLRIKLSY